MRALLKVLLLISLSLVSTGEATGAEKNLSLDYFPKGVKQGDICLIRALGPVSLQSIYGMFQGERFPMAIGAHNGIYEGLIGMDMDTRPATYEVRLIATGKDQRVYSEALSLKVEKADFGVQKLSLPSSLVDLDAKTLERVDKEARQLKAVFKAFRNERLWKGAFIRPVEGELSTSFGVRRFINGQPRSSHTGVDLKAEEGTPVLACNSGVVALVDEHFFSGKSVILDHGWGLYSMYFHLSESLVKEGERVSTGAMLGRVGSTGRSTSPHLHWGINLKGARVDPLSLLKL